MNAVVISNGNKPSIDLTKKIVGNSDIVYCCDGAANWAKENDIRIDILLGDMDSIFSDTLDYYNSSPIEVIILNKEKDMTDTQYAADLAVENGADSITIIGAVGSRIDHSLANMHVLVRLFKKGIHAKIIDDNNTIYVLGKGENIIQGEIGECVSILPVGRSVTISKTFGLYYPIKDKTLFVEEPIGVSNVFTENKAILDIKEGEVFIIISKD